MGIFRRGLLLVLFCSICGIAEGQDRDVRGERLILDDGNSNLVILRTPAGPIVGGTLTVPDPAGAGTLLVSNPTVGWQSVDGDLFLGGELRFLEGGIGPDYVGFLAPAAVSANTIWTLPAADGSSGQVLTTNGAGILSWGTPSGGAGTGEPYLTASASGTLSAERVLTAGTGVSVVDGGANSTMTVAIGQSVATSAVPTFAGLTIPSGNINVTTGSLAITTGNVSTTTGNITATTGSVGTLSGNLYADNGGELRLFEPDGSGSEYTAFKSGAQSGNITYTLPATNGTAGQVLRVAAAPAPTGTTATLEWGTASGATGFSSVGGMVFVRKGTDESVVSSTTLQNDDDLVVALNANQTYEIQGILYITTTNAGHDFQMAFTVPSGASMKIPYFSSRAGSTNYLENDVLTTSGTAGTVVDLASGTLQVVTVRGTVRTGGNSGDLQLQWADDNTGGTQTVTMETDSFLRVVRVE
ncbi:MAG: hypothetical protein AB7H80_00350 [Candidatus Kapaibacterium sp.]